MPAARVGHLAELFAAAGLPNAESLEVAVDVRHASFEDWWQSYTLGVGPAGAHVASLSSSPGDRLRERCRELLPPPPFTTCAAALAARAVVPAAP